VDGAFAANGALVHRAYIGPLLGLDTDLRIMVGLGLKVTAECLIYMMAVEGLTIITMR
jgi:hypothetical protein